MFNLRQEGDRATLNMKQNPKFPYWQGHLRDKATSGRMISPNVYRIKFSSKIAPYVVYLQEGTRPHDIPNAFGKGDTFGIGGRFDGKFHPGSTKHKGFIDKIVLNIVNDIAKRYKGVVEKI